MAQRGQEKRKRQSNRVTKKNTVDYSQFGDNRRQSSDDEDFDEFKVRKRKKKEKNHLPEENKDAGNTTTKKAPKQKSSWNIKCTDNQMPQKHDLDQHKRDVITESDYEKEGEEAKEESGKDLDTSSHLYSPLPSSNSQGERTIDEQSPLVNKQVSLSPVKHELKVILESPLKSVDNGDLSESPSKRKRKSPAVAKKSKATTTDKKAKVDSFVQNVQLQEVKMKRSVPKWTPPGPSGSHRSLDPRPSTGLRIGLSRKHVHKPLHS